MSATTGYTNFDMSAISDSERLPRPHVGSRERKVGPLARLGRRWNEAKPLVAPPREAWPLALRRIRLIGFAVLGIELAVLCWWSALLVNRFALTGDFATYSNAMYLISHGSLLPVDSFTNHSVLRGAFELVLWPLAFVQLVWPQPVTLKILESLAMVAGQGVALAWICDIAAVRTVRDRSATAAAAGLVGLGVLLLVADPWYVFNLSFDFHPEPFMVLALVATARDVFRDRRTAWIWALLLCVCSAVGATYLVALGIGAAASGRCRLRRGLSMALFGLAWLVLVSALNADSYNAGVFQQLVGTAPGLSSLHGQSSFDVIKAVLEHPGRAWSILWPNHTNIWANVSAPGIVGLLWPPALFSSLFQSLESGLIPVRSGFSTPGFTDNILAEPMVTIGTIVVCAALLGSKRYRRLVVPLGALLAANAVVWAVIWFPTLPTRWLRVSSAAASTLRTVQARIGPNDEVVASQGVVGAFGIRRQVYQLPYNQPVLVRARRVWLIVTPRAGIEILSPAESYADISRIASLPGSRLVVAKNGVWAFEWNPPAGTKTVRMATSDTSIPAWAAGGKNGQKVQSGSNRSNWYTASTAKPGYALSGDYWREPAGNYVASVSLAVAAGGPNVHVEVWNASADKLLVRRVLQHTNGRITLRLPVDARTASGRRLFGGWGPWSMTPAAPRRGANLEIRVWSPGGLGRVKVYSAGIRVRD